MGDSKKIKELSKKLDISIQSFYRIKKIKELRPDLYERLKKGEKMSITKTYQIATGRSLKNKKTICLDSIESQKLDIAKDVLELNYSEMLSLGLKCLYEKFEIDFEIH